MVSARATRTVDDGEAEWDMFIRGLERDGSQNKLTVDHETLERLIMALDHQFSFVVWRAEELLGLLGAQAQPAVPRLIQAISDSNLDVQGYAAEALGFIGDARAVPPLVTALRLDTTTWDDGLSVDAALALSLIGPEATLAIEPLKLTLEADSRFRHAGVLHAASAFALYRITGEQRYFERFAPAFLNENDEDVQYKLLKSMSGLPVDFLVKFLPLFSALLEADSLYPDAIEDVVAILARMGPAARITLPLLQGLVESYTKEKLDTDHIEKAIAMISAYIKEGGK